jgi:hypothetical protein
MLCYLTTLPGANFICAPLTRGSRAAYMEQLMKLSLYLIGFTAVVHTALFPNLKEELGRLKAWHYSFFNWRKQPLTYAELLARGEIPPKYMPSEEEASNDPCMARPRDHPLRQLTLPAEWNARLPTAMFSIGDKVVWSGDLFHWWMMISWQLRVHFGGGPFVVEDIIYDETRKQSYFIDAANEEDDFIVMVMSKPVPVQKTLVLRDPKGYRVFAPAHCFTPKKKFKKRVNPRLVNVLQKGLPFMDGP